MCEAMEAPNTDYVDFYMTVSSCERKQDKEHASRHNSFAAVRLSELLSHAGVINKDVQIQVIPCCSEKNLHNGILDHKKHYIIVRTNKAVLRHFVAALNQGFSCVLSDENDEATSLAVDSLTPGQKAWLGSLAVRMVEFSEEQKAILTTLKSCQNYSSVSPIPLPTIPNPISLSAFGSNKYSSALFSMNSTEVANEMTVLHNIPERRFVWANFRSHVQWFPTVKWLRWYLGDSIGFYFAWLQSYCIALAIPAILGLLTWICVAIANAVSSEEPKEEHSLSAFMVVYGLTIVVWGLVCNKIFRRKQSQLSEDWMSPAFANAADMSGWVNSHMDQLRPAFKGKLRKSPITGEMELYFPYAEQRILFLTSMGITGLCVLLALFINVLLLNLEGIINPDRSPHLHFRFVGFLCDPGRIFDPKDGSLNFVPGILHPIVVNVMNQVVFRQIAMRLTDMENHKTQTAWDHSLIIKRFLFEAVDAYASPFYLGVILVDWNALHSFLLTTFATDSIRRLIVECLLPYLSSQIRSHRATSEKKKSDDGDSLKVNVDADEAKAIKKAVFGVDYEPFDDFLEMVLEQGYIVLFAVACPPYLACLAFFCAWVESFFDGFKLLQLVRRPVPQWLHRKQNVWLMMLSVQAWMALFTNLCLLGSHTDWNLSTLILLEHILIGIGLIIELGFSNIPVAASNAFHKRIYERYSLKASAK
ncbi:unnamed protein product [Hymenolepis diminuta]|uniref:Anoctamin n=2 Tax=Hymenolepis diminuta TaxID=6216 RepID=A0A0R3S960_HYMDI|nr:unnamed protein product [Hymenolepis diminuta]